MNKGLRDVVNVYALRINNKNRSLKLTLEGDVIVYLDKNKAREEAARLNDLIGDDLVIVSRIRIVADEN